MREEGADPAENLAGRSRSALALASRVVGVDPSPAAQAVAEQLGARSAATADDTRSQVAGTGRRGRVWLGGVSGGRVRVARQARPAY